MKRTISIRLDTTQSQENELLQLQEAYHSACNQIVPDVVTNRCWNRVALHHLVYTKVRLISRLGSQMVCNAIYSVCKVYQAKSILPTEAVSILRFHKGKSVHFDKRTYTIKGETISLYTLGKRIQVPMRFGPFQKAYFSQGVPKEAELICKKGKWYFNLVVDLTNIRKRIKAGKRMRTRLHRWSFCQLQMFIQYKAEASGLSVLYVNPAYSSQTCSICGSLGVRNRHQFKCSCGNQQHADWNASRNLCRFALDIPKATCAVNRTQVAVKH